MEEKKLLNDDQLIERIEKAAREGACEGAKQGTNGLSKKSINIPWKGLAFLIFVFWITTSVIPNLNPFNHLKTLVDREEAVENHDLTLENHGILGYTVADFEEAILGDASQLKKLEVFTTEISDLATITKAGLGKFKVFSKCKYITYHGQATYTVDLSQLNQNNISYDEKTKVVTLSIPKPVQEEINIPEENIEYGDTTKGILAFGDITLKPEEIGEVQGRAREKMEKKLEETNSMQEAERFAKLSVWEIYQPIVNGVSPECTLEVEFQ